MAKNQKAKSFGRASDNIRSELTKCIIVFGIIYHKLFFKEITVLKLLIIDYIDWIFKHF